jgi:hypothetical protein
MGPFEGPIRAGMLAPFETGRMLQWAPPLGAPEGYLKSAHRFAKGRVTRQNLPGKFSGSNGTRELDRGAAIRKLQEQAVKILVQW